MAHPMLRGAAAAIDGEIVMRAAGAGLAGIVAFGEAAARVRGVCERRRKPPAHHSILCIHSQVPSDNSIAQLVQADDHSTTTIVLQAQNDDRFKEVDIEDFRNIIQQQLEDISKLMGIIEILTNKLDKVTAENFDMQKHMAQDFENFENKIRVEYDKIQMSYTERMREDNEAAIRKLELQLANLQMGRKEK